MDSANPETYLIFPGLASTGSILEVVETLVVSITTGSTSTNTILATLERCFFSVNFPALLYYSILQVGMRNFHVHPNNSNLHQPGVNLDKLWSLVSEQVLSCRIIGGRKLYSRFYPDPTEVCWCERQGPCH